MLSLLSGHVFSPDGRMCQMAVVISDSLADKPLWLDGPLLLVG